MWAPTLYHKGKCTRVLEPQHIQLQVCLACKTSLTTSLTTSHFRPLTRHILASRDPTANMFRFVSQAAPTFKALRLTNFHRNCSAKASTLSRSSTGPAPPPRYGLLLHSSRNRRRHGRQPPRTRLATTRPSPMTALLNLSCRSPSRLPPQTN